MMIESSKSIVQIQGLLLRQYKAVWTSNIQHEANVYFIWRMCSFFPPQNWTIYNHQKHTVLFYQQKTFHKHTPSHPSPCLFKQKRKNTLRGWTNRVFFCSTSRAWHRGQECWREDLEPISKRRLAVLDPLEVASWRWIFERKTGCFPCVVLLGV